MNALFRAYPALEGKVPWTALGDFPTPVERVLDIWVKRDDRSGALYGGNKVRKLEFLLAEAIAKGAQRIVTMGAIGSHQVLATTLYARRAGLEVCGLVFPQPPTEHARETLLRSLGAGACLHAARGVWAIPFAYAGCARAHREVRAFIGPGGSTPLGTLGYVAAALELGEQIRAGELPAPAAVYTPFGSGGTAAGLAVGFRLAKLETRVVAVRVYDRFFAHARHLARLANRTAALLRSRGGPDAGRFRARDFDMVHDQFGGAYGRPTPAADAALARATEAGLHLETTYSAKALAAVLASERKDVLFWNTFSSAPPNTLGDPASLPPGVARMLTA